MVRRAETYLITVARPQRVSPPIAIHAAMDRLPDHPRARGVSSPYPRGSLRPRIRTGCTGLCQSMRPAMMRAMVRLLRRHRDSRTRLPLFRPFHSRKPTLRKPMIPSTLIDNACTGNRTTRAKRRRWVEPVSPNSFRHVVEKGFVSDTEARELYHIFFSGCHLFIPLFDPSYDTYEALKERSPWCFDAILAVASKIRAGNGPPSVTFYKCLEEAQGIARSTLFGPAVRKEAVQAMLLLAAWSTSGWLPCGHALRMGLDLGLHLALEKLADSGATSRSEEEERHLVVSARTWLCIYWFDHQCVYVAHGIPRSC